MKKIFIPTDFSRCAENAAKAAANIAEKSKAEIFLFHSLDVPMEWEKIPVEKEANYPETKQQVAYAKKKASRIS